MSTTSSSSSFQWRPWVALSSIPVVVGANNERARRLAPGASDLFLDIQLPQHGASYLFLPERIIPEPRNSYSGRHPFTILSACSDRFLFIAVGGTRAEGVSNPACFLGNAQASTAVRLPDVPAHLGVNIILRNSIGLIADPRHGGHYMVAQLHPTCKTRHKTLLCYSTVTGQWTARPLASAERHEPWGANGVLAHGGLLWWIDICYGMLVCDPFAADDNLHLRFIRLPVSSMRIGGLVPRPEIIAQRRLIRPSQGKLRYVEIQGFPNDLMATNQQPTLKPQVRMFTLVFSQEGQQHCWVHEYTVSFPDIWSHYIYAGAGLPWGVVPSLAFIDPNNPNTLYFFQGRTLFAVDGYARQVLHHLRYSVDSTHGDLMFQNSLFVAAWELPLTLFVNGRAPDGTRFRCSD
jgi:hypothetical protein